MRESLTSSPNNRQKQTRSESHSTQAWANQQTSPIPSREVSAANAGMALLDGDAFRGERPFSRTLDASEKDADAIDSRLDQAVGQLENASKLLKQMDAATRVEFAGLLLEARREIATLGTENH